MAQVPKAHVREAIVRAAAEELARSGYAGTTLAAVAERAGTSIGNLYKYFAGKDELFAAAVPPSLAREAEALLRRRIEALGARRHVAEVPAGDPYEAASDELLEFARANRHALLFLLAHAEGTEHEGFARDLAQKLARLAIAYAGAAYPGAAFDAASRRALARIYRGFLGSIASILAEEKSRAALEHAVRLLGAHHLAGLRSFFEAVHARRKDTP